MPHWTEEKKRERRIAAWCLTISAILLGLSVGGWTLNPWAGVAAALVFGSFYFIWWIKS